MPLSIWQRVLQVKVPAYVALLILIFVTSTIFFLRPEPIERTIAGPAILKIDTVYVTKRDTVFRDKVIYTLVRTPEAGNKRQAEVIPAVIPVGVSMKEKDELNKLLVSGSD